MLDKFPGRRRLWLLTLLVFSCVFLLQSLSYADNGELETIHKAIKEKKAHWVAGETSVSKLSPEARKKHAAALKPFLREEEHEAAAEEQAGLASVTAPPSYNWGSTGDATAPSYVTPVRDQGGCGSCWAFATTAALESQVLLENNAPGVNLDLSEQLMVSCSGAGNCGGGYINSASDYLRDLGLPAETYFPYTATNNFCANASPDWTDNVYRLSGWHWAATTSPTVDGLKNALVTYGPLATMMSVYADFFSYQSGVYSYVSGTFQGWHCILIVGYDDAGQYFIAKNSWGAGWGESGFFRVAYSELKNVVNFGDYTVAYEGSPSLLGPQPEPQPQPQPQPQPCTFSLSPTSQTFKAAGGSGSIIVSTQGSCAWTAVSNVAWISVNSGNTGSGSGTVSFAVATNGGAQRSGTITAVGQTFTVTQQKLLRTRK